MPSMRRARSPRPRSPRGTPPIWTGLPKLIVVLLGGFTSNFVWCAILNVRNRTAGQYFSSTLPAKVPSRDEETIIETAVDAPSEEVVERIPWPKRDAVDRVPLASNYFWSALAGVTWYMQFFCYTMGETQMGAYKFSSWTLHMASIIIFSSLVGHLPQGVAGQQPLHPDEAGPGPGDAHPLDDGRRLRELPGDPGPVTGAGARRISPRARPRAGTDGPTGSPGSPARQAKTFFRLPRARTCRSAWSSSSSAHGDLTMRKRPSRTFGCR